MSNPDQVNSMKEIAKNLWDLFFRKKTEQMLGSYISFYRASVTGNPGGNYLTIQRPFDNEITVRCVPGVSDAIIGTEVIVAVLGSYSNSIVVGDASLSNCGGYSFVFGTSDWTQDAAGVWNITIPSSTHKKGSHFLVDVWFNDNGNYFKTNGYPNTGYSVFVGNNGDLTIKTTERFSGKIIIS